MLIFGADEEVRHHHDVEAPAKRPAVDHGGFLGIARAEVELGAGRVERRGTANGGVRKWNSGISGWRVLGAEHPRRPRYIRASHRNSQCPIGHEVADHPACAQPHRTEIGNTRRGVAVDIDQIDIAAGRHHTGDRRHRRIAEESAEIVVEVDADDGVAPLRVVADEPAVGSPVGGGLAKHAPFRRVLLVFERRRAQEKCDQRFGGAREIHFGAAVAKLAAEIEAVPARVCRRGWNEGRRAAQRRHVEFAGTCVRRLAKQAENNEPPAHDGPFDSRR